MTRKFFKIDVIASLPTQFPPIATFVLAYVWLLVCSSRSASFGLKPLSFSNDPVLFAGYSIPLPLRTICLSIDVT